MLDDLRECGFSAHAKFGTWILDDLNPLPMIAHCCGRGFLTEEVRLAKVQANLEAAKLSGSGRANDDDDNDEDFYEAALHEYWSS